MIEIHTVSINNISKYRTELMGVAAILILFCHAPGNNVMMPALMEKILSYGNVGVDMFLLLSGMGLFYSLNKKPASTSLLSWYTKRFIRILIPYWLILIPYLIYKVCDRGYSLDDVFLNLTAMSYWLSGDGDWFISLILLLYIITPPCLQLLTNKRAIKDGVLSDYYAYYSVY